MGVACRITLPTNVRLYNVAQVMALLAGAQIRLEESKEYPGKPWVRVDGVKTKPGCCDGLSEITITDLGEDAKAIRNSSDGTAWCTYHFESDADAGEGRLMLPKSTAFWIAIGRGLVNFFGGEIDYQDCDSSECDYKKKWKSNRENCPSDGAPFWDLEERIKSVKPITAAEYQRCKKWAAY